MKKQLKCRHFSSEAKVIASAGVQLKRMEREAKERVMPGSGTQQGLTIQIPLASRSLIMAA
jgi:hypothetical protein